MSAETPLPTYARTYLQAREDARAAAAAAKWAALTEREQRLVREAAVLAFVHGTAGPSALRSRRTPRSWR